MLAMMSETQTRASDEVCAEPLTVHSLLAALFTLVFSFSHGNIPQRSSSPDMAAVAPSRYSMEYTPTRRELVQAEFEAASYAGAACVSCRRMNPVYRTR